LSNIAGNAMINLGEKGTCNVSRYVQINTA